MGFEKSLVLTLWVKRGHGRRAVSSSDQITLAAIGEQTAKPVLTFQAMCSWGSRKGNMFLGKFR